MFVDDQVLQHKAPDFCQPVLPSDPYKWATNEQWEKELDWKIPQFSVLLCRTGDDTHLSSPVSFQSLYDSGKASLVQRLDCDGDVDVVRIRLDTAVQFILDLIHRECEAISEVGLSAEKEKGEHLEACDKWVDLVMAHAAIVGIDNNGFTWEAVRRANAALNGEAFHMVQVDAIWDHLGLMVESDNVSRRQLRRAWTDS
ncbi:hypothetical protein F5Y16DRAFT_403353 [Xylariaceae sp. FL0255]|nr:hypothetical protein F5Y16DRAFT_403353 [Xylariaceae sp. FL0255]